MTIDELLTFAKIAGEVEWLDPQSSEITNYWFASIDLDNANIILHFYRNPDTKQARFVNGRMSTFAEDGHIKYLTIKGMSHLNKLLEQRIK